MPSFDLNYTISCLETYGFAVVENVLSSKECMLVGKILDELEENLEQNSNSGFIQTESLIQLINVHYQRPKELMQYINKKQITDIVSSVLKDDYCLSNFNASRPLYSIDNGTKRSRIHIDSRQPCRDSNSTSQIVAMYCIDDFTQKNGATIVVPMSNHSGIDPRNVLNSEKYAIPIEAKAGSVVYILGQTWHDIGKMIEDQRRWGIIAYYSKWWIKPTYDFVQSCTDEIYAGLSIAQKKLRGFNTIPPAKFHLRQKTKIDQSLLPEDLEEYFTMLSQEFEK